jgi:hypothetical protein
LRAPSGRLFRRHPIRAEKRRPLFLMGF